MKTTNNVKTYKARIRKAWAINMIAYFVAAALYTIGAIWAVETFDIYWGFTLLGPVAGFILAAPILLRQDNIIRHFERMIKKEKAQ